MIVELSKKQYEYVLDCFYKLKPQYYEDIKNSLVIDNTMYTLGFLKGPNYIIDIKLPSEVITNILSYIKNIKAKSKCNNVFDDDLYSEFDYYVEFYNLLIRLEEDIYNAV